MTPGEVGLFVMRRIALLMLGQMRLIEERISDPSARWSTLREALHRLTKGDDDA